MSPDEFVSLQALIARLRASARRRLALPLALPLALRERLARSAAHVEHALSAALVGTPQLVATEQRSEPSAPADAHAAPSSALYTHEPHAHVPQSATTLAHAARIAKHASKPPWQQRVAHFNQTLGLWITQHSGTMACAYIFAGIGIGSLVGVFTNNTFLAAVCGSFSSYFLQLVLLPVINYGTNLLSQHTEAQAAETYRTAVGTYHHLDQVAKHLVAQDGELLRQTEMLVTLVRHLLPSDLPDPTPPTPPVSSARKRRAAPRAPSSASSSAASSESRAA